MFLFALSPALSTADAGDCLFGDSGCGCATGCCDDGCGECGESLFSCGGDCLSWLKKSDHCYSDFISPITNPVFFEDPRTLTEARFIYINHSLPGNVGGRSVNVMAMQLRAAITEDLSIIATKDGFITSDNPLIRDGWADVAAGLKLNVYKDYCSQTLVSVGATYEAPFGSGRALQGNGDGEFHLFASSAKRLAPGMHLMSNTGIRLPVDGGAESTVWNWSNHVDKKLGDSNFYFLGECNWFHWMSGGNTPLPVDGIDLFNLGSNVAAGQDVVTAAIGVKYKPSINTEIGFAWETPVTSRRDVMDDRLTFDWIFRY